MGQLNFDNNGNVVIPDEIKSVKEMDYLHVLKALYEIPFPLGKNNLVDFLKGKDSKMIEKNKLAFLDNFGSLNYSDDKISAMIERLMQNGMIKIVAMDENQFSKVLVLTKKGIDEIDNPTLSNKNILFSHAATQISEKDREIFRELDSFLKSYNEEQKKAIIESNDKILCIAGAGSGKTTVLVKRIEFLVKYKSVSPDKILAITFTRKARREMARRLANLSLSDIMVETFNSFCEKVLRSNAEKIYSIPTRVMNYGDKIMAMNYALNENKIGMDYAIDNYFTRNKINNRTSEELANLLMNDCFFILDYYKSRNEKLEDFSHMAESENKHAAKMIYNIAKSIEEYMQENGLRDFTDQMIDTIKLFKQDKSVIPQFEHILVDEYQDVNSSQIELIDLLNPKNIFGVGDPRQSIFGWRGSDVHYIINFPVKYPECSVITLTKNYRSKKHIVETINSVIKEMNLPDLEHTIEGEKCVHLSDFDSEDEEYDFVISRILESEEERHNIFVLARTNRQLKDLSERMKKAKINHVVRNDEVRKTAIAKKEDVTLATIHAIKGLEAKIVFVVGCTSLNFPCRASEHPVIEMVKAEEYDKEAEERRLFYVAMSRAAEKLHLTYSGKKPTYFISEGMMEIIEGVKRESKGGDEKALLEQLKKWRIRKSKEEKVPAYCIFTDLTLNELASKRPKTSKELEDIYGIGKTKIMKYGEEVLDIVG
ncbi:MAG: UvrD-helicase domain-containing protein [archaeon]